MYHAHVCEQRGCGCVFPDARLLELVSGTLCSIDIFNISRVSALYLYSLRVVFLGERRAEVLVCRYRSTRPSAMTRSLECARNAGRRSYVFLCVSGVPAGCSHRSVQFECHLVTCGRNFSTPKTRRMHLIQAHGYPKEFFFAVTNKGVGGLLKKWGEGASLLRKTWKPRENGPAEPEDADEGEAEDDTDADDADAMDAEGAHRDTHSAEGVTATDDDDDDDEDQILIEKMQIERPSAPTDSVKADSFSQEQTQGRKPRKAKGKEKHDPNAKPVESDVERLTKAIDALALVPTTIRFGRGAKRGALQGGGHGGRGHARRGSASAYKGQRTDADNGGATSATHAGAGADEGTAMDVDVDHAPSSRGGRGFARGGGGMRGIIPIARAGGPRGRGRGRGRGVPPGAVLGAGVGRGMGPGRGVGKDAAKA